MQRRRAAAAFCAVRLRRLHGGGSGDDFGRSLDELPPQTRRLLELTDEMVLSETKRLGLDRAELRRRNMNASLLATLTYTLKRIEPTQ